MNSKTGPIDLINIGLILLSLFVALKIPFQLFLFSYIILGPLHYMTEIGWLSQRNFFIREKVPKWPLFALGSLCALVLIYLEFRGVLYDHGIMGGLSEQADERLDNLITSFTFVSFLSIVVFITIQKNVFRFLAIAVLFLISFFLYNIPWFLVLFGVMLPTLVHTTIFTGSFMLQGAIKNKSTLGYIAFIVFVLAYILIFYLPIDPAAGQMQVWIQELFLAGEFFVLNYNLFNLFYDASGSQLVLDTGVGLKIQAFIAFAYTYHYLNWFSKTEVIKWHRIPRKWMIATGLVWLGSVTLHFIDIKFGIAAIGLLSLLHVYLEFPLNHESFISIAKALAKGVRI